MTDAERQDAFKHAYDELVAKYGYTFVSENVVRRFGAMVQVEPIVSLVPIDGWKAPDKELADESANGHRS